MLWLTKVVSTAGRINQCKILRTCPSYSTDLLNPCQSRKKHWDYRFQLRQKRRPDAAESPRFTPQMVSSVLRMNEETVVENHGAVKSHVTNSLQANKLIEDRNAQGRLVHGGAFLFSVIDGHGGCACAQAVGDLLFDYIGVAMADNELLKGISDGAIVPLRDLVQHRGEIKRLVHSDLATLQKKNLMKFAKDLMDIDRISVSVPETLVSSFLRLDEYFTVEAKPSSLEKSGMEMSCYLDHLAIAFSGAVSCVAYIDSADLFVASIGDSQAVLGVYNNNRWEAVPLTNIHDANNPEEVERITKCHPNESSNIIKKGRLFGELVPLRAFGNVRFKWTKAELHHLLNTSHIPKTELLSALGDALVPRKYHTPPYLDAEPEVIHHKLTPKDKFLVLASDGLWECLSQQKVIDLVAGHMDGQQVLVNYTPPEGATLKEVNTVLTQRIASLENRALDSNAATHLLRSALGPDHGQVSAQLTLPEPIVRQYRDDITITIVFFDSEYIKQFKVIHSH